MRNTPFHINFKLQGKTFNSVNELLIFSKELSEDIFTFLELWFNEKDIIEVKTSGSTGAPKSILLKKKYMINSALATGKFFNLFENTKALLCLPVDFIAGKMMLVRALTLGWKLDFVAPISNPLKNNVNTYDFVAMVPLQLENSLADISKIKKLIVGGAPVSNELLNKLQKIDTDFFATYGMTETITHIAVKKLNNFKSDILREEEKDYYSILPNIKISKDERDCLIIEAPKISDQKIITNDIVNLISEDKFSWIGRFDSIINSGGVKLHPEEIEAKLSNCIKNDFFVAGIKDDKLGERLILIIENSDKNRSKESIFNQINKLETLSKYQKPKEIYFVKEFVKTPTEKINRKETLNQLFKAP
ncbi:MAG: AMP-binding protein [Lutibacter sp.]|uniref:AMP-binding protein n=1 Tax=Lutibacter sp. TaxID=1925666 RepID=UPI00299D9945|nr:AMP-binding protein [Lutibacter sp.]MDX1829107.1 AMP-binding protein [Lutibacter sp.]